MSEYVRQAQSYAQQSLAVNPSGNEVVRRSAMCPRHQFQTSDFLGVTADGWLFKCREGHNFFAKADKSAPKTPAEVEAWTAKQRQIRLDNMEGRNRGA